MHDMAPMMVGNLSWTRKYITKLQVYIYPSGDGQLSSIRAYQAIFCGTSYTV